MMMTANTEELAGMYNISTINVLGHVVSDTFFPLK